MSNELLQALHDLGKEKGIAPEVIMEAVEAALISAYKKNFGATQNVQVSVDQVTGDFHVYTVYDVVEVVENDKTEISLEDARKLMPSYEIGDVVTEEVTPRNFGRIAAQTAKQVVVQRLREAERGMIYSEFSSSVLKTATAILTWGKLRLCWARANRFRGNPTKCLTV